LPCPLSAKSRHSALRQRLALFDHLVRGDAQTLWHVEAKRLRGLEVDHEIKLGRQLNGQIGRLFAPQNAVASSALAGSSTPMRRMCSPCCARATNGQAPAEPTIPLMKSRRRIAAPKAPSLCGLCFGIDAITAGIGVLAQSQILSLSNPAKSAFWTQKGILRFVQPAQGRQSVNSGGRLYDEIEAVLFKDRLRCRRTQE